MEKKSITFPRHDFFSESVRESSAPFFLTLTNQGRFSPIQGPSRHLTIRQDPSTAGVLVDLGLAANALTLGAVPWTLRTVDPGVGCYKRDGLRGCDPSAASFSRYF